MTDLTVANEILRQLGGSKFIAMTGARNLTGGEDYLSFQIGKNSGGIGGIKIILTAADDYTVEFYKVKNQIVTHDTVEGVYAEDLQEIFTDKTGLATHL